MESMSNLLFLRYLIAISLSYMDPYDPPGLQGSIGGGSNLRAGSIEGPRRKRVWVCLMRRLVGCGVWGLVGWFSEGCGLGLCAGVCSVVLNVVMHGYV